MYLKSKTAVYYANKYATPLYIYSGEIISKSYRKLQDALSSSVDIFYSIKANPSLAICKLLCNLGSGAEICSINELRLAKMAGFTPDKIIIVGPYKDDNLLNESISFQVYAIVCESITELNRIVNIAVKLGKNINILLRVNPNTASAGGMLKMGGKATQFGMSEKEVFSIAESFKSEFVKIIGIHGYLGTRILNGSHIIDNIKILIEIFTKIKSTFLPNIYCLDIGGGFGVNYYDDERPLDLEYLRKELGKILDGYQTKDDIKIIAESGRYLVAESGLLVLKVKDIKNSFGEEFVVTDGGINCFMAAGNGGLFQRNFPIESSSKNKREKYYNICGPLCTPTDIIAKNIKLKELSLSDHIFMSNCGAYGLTASPILFLSHKQASEIMLYKNKDYLIRDRSSISLSCLTQNDINLQ